ncbi:protein serine/threonine phosphatase [Artemisia annua]|uniref:Protein serine/threonine phosphatase n=1 Tax=Artemisia annua TaxID=35608 RepID=A0A2U1MMX1_ARTAN|nr:protein serine/threonine phosphatase [Artemisia annua]
MYEKILLALVDGERKIWPERKGCQQPPSPVREGLEEGSSSRPSISKNGNINTTNYTAGVPETLELLRSKGSLGKRLIGDYVQNNDQINQREHRRLRIELAKSRIPVLTKLASFLTTAAYFGQPCCLEPDNRDQHEICTVTYFFGQDLNDNIKETYRWLDGHNLTRKPYFKRYYRNVSKSAINIWFTSPDGNHGNGASIIVEMSTTVEDPMKRLLKVAQAKSPNIPTHIVTNPGRTKKKHQGFKRWALGVLIYFMPQSEMPFGSWRENELDTFAKIAKGQFTLSKTFSREVVELINKLHMRSRIDQYLETRPSETTAPVVMATEEVDELNTPEWLDSW